MASEKLSDALMKRGAFGALEDEPKPAGALTDLRFDGSTDFGPLFYAGASAETETRVTLGSVVMAVGAPRTCALPDNCDGQEQEAFEAWASAQGLSMARHPLHYLFLDPKTDAARQAWNECIRYCRRVALSKAESV